MVCSERFTHVSALCDGLGVPGVRGVQGVMGRLFRFSFAIERLMMRAIVLDGVSSNGDLQDLSAAECSRPVDQAIDLATAGSSQVPVMTESAIPQDFPPAAVISRADEFIWDEDLAQVDNFVALGRLLGASGDLFRAPAYASGLVLAVEGATTAPKTISRAPDLAAVIADRLRVRVIRNGKSSGSRIPSGQQTTMLASEAFLQRFNPLDTITAVPLYLPNFDLSPPGYSDGGRGFRILYAGPPPTIGTSTETIEKFLDVMDFASPADRTGAVAGALTSMLRNHFPGAKPIAAVTSTRSHAGKDTLIKFIAGGTPTMPVSYQSTDWALERAIVGGLNHCPATGVVIIDNARLGSKDQFIRSAFLERTITDELPLLFSTGTGAPVRRRNDLVFAISTNFGSISEDLNNRSLPIHLECIGDVATRVSPIGNPKHEFLPANQAQIEAELRGMIERWKRAGQPRDVLVRHPFSEWAAIIGGILLVNGFKDFLGNYSIRRSADDPLRRALGLLGAARRDEWLRSAEWAKLVADIGVQRAIFGNADWGSDKACERTVGIVFSAHTNETLTVDTEDERLVVKLERARRRWQPGDEPKTKYRFVVCSSEPVPVDSEAATAAS